MAQDKKGSTGQQNATQQNEGEGNRTAARKFDADERRFVQSGQVDKAAHEAEEALDGDEKAELEKAEAEGKRGDPKTKR